MTDSGRASHFTTSRPVAVLIVFVAAVVFGYFSYGRLGVQLMPEMSYPTITVRTEYPGSAPEEVEKDVSQPIEEALGVVSGLRRVSSISRAGVSDVVLEFSWDTAMSDAVQDTLEKLDLVELPDDAGPSLILRFDPSLDPVLELSMASTREGAKSEAELRRLRRVAELQVKRALEPVKGVAAVRVRGGLEEEIHIDLEAGKLASAGISIATVIDRLQQENINVAGGTIKDGRTDFMVRTLNEYDDVPDIAATVITVVEGREVRLEDLGKVFRSHKEREMVTRTDGGESVQIDIFKEADANMVALSKRVRLAIGDIDTTRKRGEARGGGLGQELFDDEDVTLQVVADRSLFIESSISELANTAVFGGLLAVLVLFLFLENTKSTLIIAVSIPISLLVTFAPLNLLGVSVNIMSLGGLALGVGMLVDSSIVVLESIYRCREEGDDFIQATIRGTADVRGAVVASTLTTIGVFLPMVFVEGVAGQAFGDLGVAVVLSLLVSLAVAVFFIPMLASRRGLSLAAPAAAPPWRTGWASWRTLKADLGRRPRWLAVLLAGWSIFRFLLAAFFEAIGKLFSLVVALPVLVGRYVVPVLAIGARGLAWLPLKGTRALLGGANRTYPMLLRWALDHTGAVLVIVALCLGGMYVSATRLDTELLPEVHQGEFTLEVALPVGRALEDTMATLGPVEDAILAEREGIDTVIVTYGYDAANSQRSDEGEHTARFKVLLAPSRDNADAEAIVAARIRDRLRKVPDLSTRLVRPVLFSFRTPVEVEVYGDDLVRLRQQADRVRAEMAAMPELTDVESTLRRGAPEVQIVYDRDKLRRYGLNIKQVAERVRDEVKGREATKLNRTDRRVPIVVRLREADRAAVGDVEDLIVDPEASRTVRLSSVADVRLGEGPSEVRRTDGRRVAVVRANLAPGASLGTTVAAIQSRLDSRVQWPTDLTYDISGQNQEWERSKQSLWLALALSIFLVYVIMAAQFESLLFPLVIMFSIPLAFLGSFLTLGALGVNLSIVVFLGMIMLAGIVVNNAIVLVDYINILRRRGLTLDDAVTQAGAVRLRPILMTTATTVLGLIPMALGLGDGAEIRTPLALTVISGLVVSTALTLLVIPTIYVVVDRARSRVMNAFRDPEEEEETA